MSSTSLRFMPLGAGVALLTIASLATFLGLGMWSWDHRSFALGLSAVALGAWAWVFARLQAFSSRYPSGDRTKAAAVAAVLITAAIQGFVWTQRALTEAFRDHAMVLGVSVGPGQMEFNRVAVSLVLACFGTGLLLMGMECWKQRRWWPTEDSKLSLPACCLLLGLAAAAFLAGRSRVLMLLTVG